MIQANELRIGNYVNAVDNSIVHDKDSYPFGFIQVEDILSEGINLCNCDCAAYNYEHLEPIPLTPEILEKVGFENLFDNCYSTNGKIFALFYHKDACYHTSDFLHRSNFVSIRFLHQLQNLYFALTGTELEIKELASATNN